MTPAESVEERLRALEQAIWGIRGENGLTQQLKGLRHDISDWRKEDEKRRGDDVARKEASQRALVLAFLAVTVSLIGTISALVATLAN